MDKHEALRRARREYGGVFGEADRLPSGAWVVWPSSGALGPGPVVVTAVETVMYGSCFDEWPKEVQEIALAVTDEAGDDASEEGSGVLAVVPAPSRD